MTERKLTEQDRQTLEWNIQSIYNKLQDLEATRIKIERIYKQCGMGEEFHREIDRIFSRLERSRKSNG